MRADEKSHDNILLIVLCQILIAPVGTAKQKKISAQAANKPLIAYIKNEDLVDMCGCAYEHITKDRGYTFSSDPTGETTWMNIDGLDINLKLTHFGGAKRHRIGSHYWETYEAEGVKVRLVRVVTHLCRPYSSECETTNYDVILTVIKGDRRQTVKARGQCGCV